MPDENIFLNWVLGLQNTKQMSSFTQLSLLSEKSFEKKEYMY